MTACKDEPNRPVVVEYMTRWGEGDGSVPIRQRTNRKRNSVSIARAGKHVRKCPELDFAVNTVSRMSKPSMPSGVNTRRCSSLVLDKFTPMGDAY